MADILIKSATTNSDGVASFTGLPPGTYKYVQTSSRTGYTADPTYYTITVSDSTPIQETRANPPAETGSITITKHVAGYPPMTLENATFKVMDDSGKTMMSVTTPSDANGHIVLNNLMSISGTPQTYKIKEVTPPPGYDLNTNEYSPVVTVGTNVNQDVPNTPSVSGTLNVDLNDTNYTEYGLEGAGYDLYYVQP